MHVHPQPTSLLTGLTSISSKGFNPSAIEAYCNTTEWRPNLVSNFGNETDMAASECNILDFPFFAIEAGASIMLPGMASRSQIDITNIWASRNTSTNYGVCGQCHPPALR
jgi:hypothetical protein